MGSRERTAKATSRSLEGPGGAADQQTEPAALHSRDRLAAGEASTLALRPARIAIRPIRPGIDTGLDGTILDIVTGGATVDVSAALSDGRTPSATLPSHGFDAALDRGSPIALSWTPDATVAIGGRSAGSPSKG